MDPIIEYFNFFVRIFFRMIDDKIYCVMNNKNCCVVNENTIMVDDKIYDQLTPMTRMTMFTIGDKIYCPRSGSGRVIKER
jgi:hypothetical protein